MAKLTKLSPSAHQTLIELARGVLVGTGRCLKKHAFIELLRQALIKPAW